MVWTEVAHEPAQLADNALGGPAVIPLSPDRLRTPVAVIGAPARRDQVHRKDPVPSIAIRVDIDQIPGRVGQRVEVVDQRSGRGPDDPTSVVVPEHQPRDGLEGRARATVEPVDQLDKRVVPLSRDDESGAPREIQLGVVAGIGP